MLTGQVTRGSRVRVRGRGEGAVIDFHEERSWLFGKTNRITYLLVRLDEGGRSLVLPSNVELVGEEARS